MYSTQIWYDVDQLNMTVLLISYMQIEIDVGYLLFRESSGYKEKSKSIFEYTSTVCVVGRGGLKAYELN